jgi:hypothetical protein
VNITHLNTIKNMYLTAKRNGLNDQRAQYHAARKGREIGAPHEVVKYAIQTISEVIYGPEET